MIDLNDENPDVNLVPGDGLENRPLGSLDIQAEEASENDESDYGDEKELKDYEN